MKRFLFILLIHILTLAALPAAPATTIPRTRPAPLRPAPDGQRFLFAVDISSAMRGTEAANRQALFDLIFTGFDGQMRTGDSFGFWLFNQELHQEFPMQVWEESKPIEAASNAAKFLREQKYSGKSRADVLMPRLLKLVKNVRDVTVVILSDGEATIEGTPFDAKISAVYERRKSERNKEQKPFVTVLIARGGMIVTGAVVIAGEYVELPARPAPALAGGGATNSVSSTGNALPIAAAPNPVIPPSQPGAPPETGEPKTSVSLTTHPAVPTVQPATPSGSKDIRIVTRSNPPPQQALVAAAASVSTHSPAALLPAREPPATPSISKAPPEPPKPPNPSPLEATTAPPPTVATVASAQPEQLFRPAMTVAAREPAPSIPGEADPMSKPAPSVTVAVMPASGLTGIAFLTIGGVLLAGCVGLLALVLRRPKPSQQTSIITRSMDRS